MYQFQSKSGKNIILRHPNSNDFHAFYEFAKKIEAEDTFILLNPDEPVTEEEEHKHLNEAIESIDKNTATHLFVFDGHNMIGSCAIKIGGRRKHHVGYFGISILSDYRGEGIGKRLAELTISEAYKNLNITIVMLDCIITNKIAQNLYHSLGFSQCGLLPKNVLYKGEYLDEVAMYKEL